MKKYGFKGFWRNGEVTRVFFATSYAEALANLAWTYPGAIKLYFEELPQEEFMNVYSINSKRGNNGSGTGSPLRA